MKIAYCGFDFFVSCFERLIARGHKPIAVFSFDCEPQHGYTKVNFNDRLRWLAESARARFTTNRITKLDLHQLITDGCEFLISAGYPFRIPIEHCDQLRGCNIHPTLLPEGRGPWPLPHLILKEIRRGGVTIHKLSPKLDCGDIICQESFPISECDNLESISSRVQMLAPRLLQQFVDDFETHWRHAQPQTKGSYWPNPSWEDRTVDWSMSVDAIMRIIRAFGKFESCATFDGKDWIIRDAIAWKESHDISPGSVAHETSREIVIAAADGFVCLRYYDLDPDWKKLHAPEKCEKEVTAST